jgi:hypothetical protein
MDPLKSGIDGHYPKPSRGTRWFLGGYPCVVIVQSFWLSYFPHPLLMLEVFVGFGWVVMLFGAIVNDLQRTGYKTALEDLRFYELAKAGLERKLPPIMQADFDAMTGKLPDAASTPSTDD